MRVAVQFRQSMRRPMSRAFVEIGDIQPLVDAAVEHGVDLAPFIQRSDEGGDARIEIADYFRIQRSLALASDDLTAVISSRKLTFKTGQFLIAQMQNATSLMATIEILAEHMNMMHGDTYNSVRFGDSRLALIIDDSHFPYRSRENTDFVELVGDCLTIKIHCLLDSLTEGAASAALRRIKLKRRRGETRRPQNAFWSVPLEYGAPAYELIYDFDLACAPLQIRETVDMSTDGLFSRVISHLDAREAIDGERSIAARTRDLLEDGLSRQSDVARKLDISVATLRRRLSEEGVQFRDLLLETRLLRAEGMLKRGASVAQATEALDYSDIRAFNRAFKRWKGKTPAAFAQDFQS